METSCRCALILLGNSGVGKSFLANRLLGDDEAFESTFSARSVTRRTEWKDIVMEDGMSNYSVANIPGLVEAKQTLIDENRTEIMKALDQCDLAIILFVFGHKNGRIPEEDLITFTRITDAYEFAPASVLLIVNGIPSNRPDDYENKTRELLYELVRIDKSRIYFFEEATSEESKTIIQYRLLDAVADCKPAKPTKKHDIELITDEIAQLKMETNRRQNGLMAQAQDFSKSQTTDLTEYALEKPLQPSPRRSLVTAYEPTSEDADKSNQFTKWVDDRKVEHDHFLITFDEQQRTSRRHVMETARQLKNTSEHRSATIAQMQSLPSRVFVVDARNSKTNSTKIVENIKDGYELIVKTVLSPFSSQPYDYGCSNACVHHHDPHSSHH